MNFCRCTCPQEQDQDWISRFSLSWVKQCNKILNSFLCLLFQDLPFDISVCVFVLEQALSVRALQEMVSSKSKDTVSVRQNTCSFFPIWNTYNCAFCHPVDKQKWGGGWKLGRKWYVLLTWHEFEMKTKKCFLEMAQMCPEIHFAKCKWLSWSDRLFYSLGNASEMNSGKSFLCPQSVFSNQNHCFQRHKHVCSMLCGN